MSRTALVSAMTTALVLVAAWALWRSLPPIVAAVGLQRYELLARVLGVFAALSVADALAARAAAALSPSPQGTAKDEPDAH